MRGAEKWPAGAAIVGFAAIAGTHTLFHASKSSVTSIFQLVRVHLLTHVQVILHFTCICIAELHVR